MNRDLKNIDKLFHENLSAAGDQPPMHIWDGIENALDLADEKKLIHKKEKRKRFAIAVLFLVAAGLTAVLWKSNGENNTIIAKTNITPVTPAGNKIVEQNNISNIRPQKQPAEPLIASDKKEFTGKPVEASIVKVESDQKESIKTNNQAIAKEEIINQGEISNSINPTKEILQELTVNNSNQINQFTREAEKTIDINHSNQRLWIPETLPYNNTSTSVKNSAPLVTIKKPRRFSVTAFFAPDITTRNLEQNSGIMTSSRDEKKEEILRTERNTVLDFTVGARVEYKLNKHFSLQSGLSFSTNTIDIAQKTVFARFDKDGALKYKFNFSSGYTYFNPKTITAPQFLGDSAQALSSTSTLHYLNIPLAVKYNIPSGRFNFSMQAGITARFITHQNIDALYTSNGTNEKGRANEIQGLKTSYFNGVVGIGADYALSSKVAFTLFPSFNFATTSINRDAPVKAYPNTLSLAVGMKFQM
jgi:hypothetical protein